MLLFPLCGQVMLWTNADTSIREAEAEDATSSGT